MENVSPTLAELGWSQWFEQRLQCGPNDRVARVVAVDRDQLLLMNQTGTFRGKPAGSYYHRHELAQDFPCVGDWVCVEKQPNDDVGMVHGLLERKTQLRRKSAGNAVEYQMIAANMDFVIIVQSCHFDFNLNRLERYLVMVSDGGADPLILLTKTDLVDADVLASQIAEIRSAGITVPVLTLSNVTQQGIDEFRQVLLPAKTYCFVGSSGVGKSTLINQLTGQGVQETQSVSGTGEGRHTTVRRELMRLAGGALVIDNPGMREFGILGAETGIGVSYADIDRLARDCRFRDCTHTNEPRCAVLAALESGELSQEHYENFVKLKEESDFHQMSYSEKRMKDREFGRYIKSAKKDLNRD